MSSKDEWYVHDDYVKNLFSLSGCSAVVTGGGRGLGQAISMGLAQAGASVLVVDLNGDAAEKVAEAINENGGQARAVRSDVTVRSQVNLRLLGSSGQTR